MPRYFFNARINGELVLDPEGKELRNADQAWSAAKMAILDLLEVSKASPSLLQSVMEVADERGEIVLEFPFAEALG